MTWVIAEPLKSVYVLAEPDGVYIRSNEYDLTSDHLKLCEPITPCGQLLPSLIPQLLEQGYAEPIGKAIRLPYQQFVSLHDDGISAFDELVPWAPFYIELSTAGTLSRADFKYQIKYFLGIKQISPVRLGCFVKHLDTIFRLDRQTYSLIDQINQYRKLSPELKASHESLIHFAAIRGLADGIGTQIDQFIKNNKVLIPPAIGIDLIEEENGRISFAPYVDGVPSKDLRHVFLNTEDVTNLHIDDGHGGRIRLVFSPEQQEALCRMAKVRHLGGQEKIKVLRNPQALFDGVAGAVDLEIGNFGPRVKGIGRFPFMVQPVIQRTNIGIFEDHEIHANLKGKKNTCLNAGISCRYQDGTEETVFFQSRDELVQFNQQVQHAFNSGDGHVQLGDRSLFIDHDFADGVHKLVKRLTSSVHPTSPDDSDRKYLLIYENADKLEYKEEWEKALGQIDHSKLCLPHALKSEAPLKQHQVEGLKWLQENYLLNLRGRKGCLLADDMGLGKTLQVLAFIAWLIEQGEPSHEGNANSEAAPWNPILIIMPVMLLENEIWIQDMKKFFKNDGAIFSPWYVLHGKNLKNMRVPGFNGQEVTVQRPLLDLSKLHQYRLILTNYETIVNYQFSFASMKSDWTLVVTDEAQAQKTPKTKISHALKSLSPRFRIACTGTPVETRLLDVWNILDYIQPGELIGSAAEFTKNYEQPLNDKPELLEKILEDLRLQLDFGKRTAFILRREKTQALKGLPQKHEYKIPCLLSPQQRELHVEYITRAREGGEGNHPFTLIQGLMNLYQHPSLIPRYEPFERGGFNTVMEGCPKLSKLIDILGEIKGKGEKALIFTRSRDMQQLLATSIFESFRQRVDIINGAANRHETTTSSNTRKAMISRIRTDSNLNFIILSPEVAGIGLTLTEANHVIHYGRWWNPAKESQATDRTYRIGQERDVHVYYLIAKDPQGQFKSFDEKLDALIDRRRQMAMDFLAPMPGEQDLQNELYHEVFEDAVPSGCPRKSIGVDDVRTLPWDRFEALIAVLEQKKGHRVFLTPLNDMGMDVISIQGNQIRLIQCKHKRYGDELDLEVVAEVINACDTYRAQMLCPTQHHLRPVLATNGRLSSAMLALCRENDIEVITEINISELLKEYSCTIPDVEFMEASRATSLNQVREVMNGYRF